MAKQRVGFNVRLSVYQLYRTQEPALLLIDEFNRMCDKLHSEGYTVTDDWVLELTLSNELEVDDE